WRRVDLLHTRRIARQPAPDALRLPEDLAEPPCGGSARQHSAGRMFLPIGERRLQLDAVFSVDDGARRRVLAEGPAQTGTSVPSFRGSGPSGGNAMIRCTIGVLAYNEANNVQRTLRALLAQQLHSGVEIAQIIVIASGCTDATVALAEGIASTNPIVTVEVEPQRTGKAAAIKRLMSMAQGEVIV